MLLWELTSGHFLHFQVFITILNNHSFLPNLFIAFFLGVTQNGFVGFYMFSFWFWIFQKHKGFNKLYFAISASFLLIFPLFLHLCQVLELNFLDQSQNLHPLIPCWLLKCYLGYLPVRCHHRHEDWPCRHIHVLIPHHLTLSSIFSSHQP